MTSHNGQAACMTVLGFGLCIPDEKNAQHFGGAETCVDVSILSPMIRRRTSMATKMAVTALDRACVDAAVDKDLPTIFTSSVGEMAVTDQLCRAIASVNYPLSPTLFHNSVHNTAAGYWSMSVNSMAAMQSIAGLQDSFAMGLLEAGCQILNGAEQVLLVSYDESMPKHLLPDYQWQACAIALVLGAASSANIHLSLPYQSTEDTTFDEAFSAKNPSLAGLTLIERLQTAKPGVHGVAVSGGQTPWWVDMKVSK